MVIRYIATYLVRSLITIAESLLGGVSIQQEVLKIAILRPPQLMELLLLNFELFIFQAMLYSWGCCEESIWNYGGYGLRYSTIFKELLTSE